MKPPKITDIFGPSWITSLGGVIVFVGYIIKEIYNPALGDALMAVGAAVGLLNARDKDVTSEEHGL